MKLFLVIVYFLSHELLINHANHLLVVSSLPYDTSNIFLGQTYVLLCCHISGRVEFFLAENETSTSYHINENDREGQVNLLIFTVNDPSMGIPPPLSNPVC